jgi:hypothetical protein
MRHVGQTMLFLFFRFQIGSRYIGRMTKTEISAPILHWESRSVPGWGWYSALSLAM